MKKYNYKILYAEDDNEVRANYTELLKYYFTEVYEAQNGEEAYEKYLEHLPQIVILDINMPKPNGIELAKKIRKLDDNVKIIMLTAMDDKEYLLDAIKLQLCDYLVKPIQTSKFESILLNIAEQLENEDRKKNILILQGDCHWDKKNQLLYKNDKLIKLTKKEYLLVSLLCSNKNQIFETTIILNHVWEDEIDKEYDTNTLRALISRIKNKLDTQIFESIYNVGYKIKI
ncbi:MAG: response regulator transcription factor [Arcobacteraceae bacterium]|nr:response regulator transcription factor [Arcobacteraceae bacterium]